MDAVNVISPEHARALHKKIGVLPRAYSGISEAARRKARQELNEMDDEMVEESLKKLKEMLRDKWLKNLNDDILILFLRARKFDLSKSLAFLENFRHHHKRYPEILDTFSLETVQPAIDDLIAICLPYRTAEGCAVGIGSIRDWNTDTTSFLQLVQFVMLCMDTELQNPMSQICGCIGIVDFHGLGWNHIRQLTPGNLMFCLNALQTSIPIRLKELHLLYSSKLFGIILSIVIPLLSEKIKSRVKFHGKDVTSLHQYIPPEILPAKYGGHLGPSQDYGFNEYLRKNAAQLRKRYN